MFSQRKQLGAGWTMEINFGKRVTYALQLSGHHVKSFWSEKALHAWLSDMGVDLTDKAGA